MVPLDDGHDNDELAELVADALGVDDADELPLDVDEGDELSIDCQIVLFEERPRRLQFNMGSHLLVDLSECVKPSPSPMPRPIATSSTAPKNAPRMSQNLFLGIPHIRSCRGGFQGDAGSSAVGTPFKLAGLQPEVAGSRCTACWWISCGAVPRYCV